MAHRVLVNIIEENSGLPFQSHMVGMKNTKIMKQDELEITPNDSPLSSLNGMVVQMCILIKQNDLFSHHDTCFCLTIRSNFKCFFKHKTKVQPNQCT